MRCSSPHWRCDLMMKLPPQVNTAFEMLEAAGHEAYLVGGAVRDYVRDNSPAKDWDITTNALPEQVEEIFTGYHLIETGLKHGTVTVVIDQEPLEITTYRVDGDYSDHRHPDSVSFTRSLKDDLERRDFTMNALAYNPRTGVVDFVGGKADIAGDLVRCVGDPDRRFQEDGLRMLRALRFASVYGMTIEAATATAIHRNKHLLKGIAAERILVELTKCSALRARQVFCGTSPMCWPSRSRSSHPCLAFRSIIHIMTRMSGTIPSRSLKVSPLNRCFVGQPCCMTLGSLPVSRSPRMALATSSGIRIRVLQWRRVSSVDFASITPAKNKL